MSVSMPIPQPGLGLSAIDGSAELASRDVFLSAYAPLVAQWRASAEQRQVDLQALDQAAAEPAHPHEAALTAWLDTRKVDRFCRLMGQEGWSVQSARVRFDPLYAREILSLGHSSPSADLRRLALELFRLYEARQLWH